MRVRSTEVARRSALVAIVGLLMAGARPSAQFEKTVSSTFDGWSQLPDGSYELVFGYMNRNADRNRGPVRRRRIRWSRRRRIRPADQFLPGRQRAAFRIQVPADFKGKFTLDADLRRPDADGDGLARSELLARRG